jgi:hypothetical protein
MADVTINDFDSLVSLSGGEKIQAGNGTLAKTYTTPADLKSFVSSNPVLTGSIRTTRRSITSNHLTSNDYYIGVTQLTSDVTVTVSSADILSGYSLIVKDESGSAGRYKIIITGEGSETIDGASQVEIPVKYGSIMLFSDKANLFTIPVNNSNATDRINRLIAETAKDVFSLDDLPAPVGGVITITQDIFLMAPITLVDTVIALNSQVDIFGSNTNATITFTGTTGGFRCRYTGQTKCVISRIAIFNLSGGHLIDFEDSVTTTSSTQVSLTFNFCAIVVAGNLGLFKNGTLYFNTVLCFNISSPLTFESNATFSCQQVQFLGTNSGVTFVEAQNTDSLARAIFSGVLFDTLTNDFALEIVNPSGAISASGLTISRQNSLFTAISSKEDHPNIYINAPANIVTSTNEAFLTFNDNTTETVSPTVETLVAGTWVERVAKRFTTTTAGRVTYIGNEDKTFTVLISFDASRIGSGGAPTFSFYLYKGNGGVPSYIGYGKQKSSGKETFNLTINAKVELQNNDFLELYVLNETNTNNILMENISFSISD